MNLRGLLKSILILAALGFIIFVAGKFTSAKPKNIVVAESANENQSALPLLNIWANNGEDKVTRDELRAVKGVNVKNSAWDGATIKLFGARNEVIAFNLVLEAAKAKVDNVKVAFDKLAGPENFVISSKSVDKDHVFDFVGRNIELFFVRYLQITGLSQLPYNPHYDERHVPQRLRLPYKLPKGTSSGKFIDRPDANKFYPDIAVPMEAVGTFAIAKGENQSVWTDIYIPKDAPAGVYMGSVKVYVGENVFKEVPVKMEVLSFTLPDVPSAKTMVFYTDEDINDRYLGKKWPIMSKESFEAQNFSRKVRQAHHMLAHRHKISLIDSGDSIEPDRIKGWLSERMQQWVDVLSGELFTAQNGYDGPGVGISNGVYSIGTYGAWRRMWNPESKEIMWENSDRWVIWFEKVFPNVEYFLYLLDEPKAKDFTQVEQWASWIKGNPGPGQRLKSLVTINIVRAHQFMPSADIAFMAWGDKVVWEPIAKKYLEEGKTYWAYNGWRPSNGSFVIEDDGVALRVLGWTQFKHHIGRWFYWQSTSYKNGSHVSVETNVFQTAWTFGRKADTYHEKFGWSGHDQGNGDGVLFYPGTELRYPEENYGLAGPIASLRLKLWRRGIQDVDYLTMAYAIDPTAVDALVQKMIPKVLWEIGVTDPKDPSYVHADISWSTNPDDWERARRQLAEIIMKGQISK